MNNREIARWLEEAADEIESWGDYAIKHLQLKYHLEETVLLFRERAERLREAVLWSEGDQG